MGTTDSGEDRGGTAAKYVPARPDRLIGAEVVFPRQERPAGPGSAGPGLCRRCGSLPECPEVGADTDHKSLPHELGLIGPAVHLAKGCYRGQETVARLHNMGRPRAGSSSCTSTARFRTPAQRSSLGTDRWAGGSVAQHHELGPIGSGDQALHAG